MYQAVTLRAVGPIGPRPAATASWRTEAPQPRAAAGTVIIGALASMAILVLAGLLLTHVLAQGTVGHWDETSIRWLASHRDSGLDALTEVLSRSADTMGIVAAALLVAIVVGFRRRWDQLAILVTRSGARAQRLHLGQRHRRSAPPIGGAPGPHPDDRELPVGPHGGDAGSLRHHRPHRERDGSSRVVARAGLARRCADAGRRGLRPGLPRLSPSDRRVLRPAPRLRRADRRHHRVRRWAPVPAPAPEEAR